MKKLIIYWLKRILFDLSGKKEARRNLILGFLGCCPAYKGANSVCTYHQAKKIFHKCINDGGGKKQSEAFATMSQSEKEQLYLSMLKGDC